MFAKVQYLGFYPLGSDVEINSIKIMQTEWKILQKPKLIPIGKEATGIHPFFCNTYVVEKNGKIAYFMAQECEIGKHHIFEISEKAIKKLNTMNKRLK